MPSSLVSGRLVFIDTNPDARKVSNVLEIWTLTFLVPGHNLHRAVDNLTLSEASGERNWKECSAFKNDPVLRQAYATVKTLLKRPSDALQHQAHEKLWEPYACARKIPIGNFQSYLAVDGRKS